MTESMESDGTKIKKCCPEGKLLQTKEAYCIKSPNNTKRMYYNGNIREPIEKYVVNFEEDGDLLTNVIILRNGTVIEFDHINHVKYICNDFCVDFTKHFNVINALANYSECYEGN